MRELILHGTLKAGEPIRQKSLSERLGVSRILVTFRPHKGAVVSRLSLEEIGELFDPRALIEGDVLRRAVPRLWDTDLATARDARALRRRVPPGGRQCLGQAELGLPFRAVFTLRREQGLSYAEIAHELEVSVKTFENQMIRAAKLLRARLAGYLSLALLACASTVEAWTALLS